MGLLDQLWDDTVAGPRPDIGLGKLRKHKTFSFRSSSAKGSSEEGNVGSYGEDSTEEATRVTRSIMIVKPPGYGSGNSGSPPISPAGSTPPVSPFSGKHPECQMYPWFTVYYGGAKSPQMVEPALILECSETRGTFVI